MKKIKLLVFSDSHGREKNIDEAINAHNQKVDALVFLGDGIIGANEVFNRYPHIPHISVRGNCDFAVGGERDEALIDMGGTKILCMHGHKYDVKSTLIRAAYRAKEVEADVLLFGHTHDPLEMRRDGLVLFNPGSIGRGYPDRTYGVIEIVDGKIICGHGTV